MPSFFLTTNNIVGGAAFQFTASGDDAYLLPGVTYGSTGGSFGFTAPSPLTNVALTIDGTVFGRSGIVINTTGDSMVTIGTTGRVTGTPGASNTAVGISRGDVVNHGSITVSGGSAGFGFYSDTSFSPGGFIEIRNTGTITAPTAIRVDNKSTFVLNSGTIVGASQTAITLSVTGAANDFVLNAETGVIAGNVITGGGDDALTNAGTINGFVDLGSGNDEYVGQGTGMLVVANPALGGVANVFGFVGNDRLTGGDRSDALLGEADNDTLRGNGGIDYLDGGDNDDIVYFSIEDSTVLGGTGTDTAINTHNDFGLTFDMGVNGFEIYIGSQAGETILTTVAATITVNAGGGNDLVQGSSVGDTLRGDGGDDTILAGDGTDVLQGGLGNDILRGDDAIDTLNGGEGNDRFVFNGVFGGNDVIQDFSIGEDKIQILRSGFLSPASWNAGALDPARFVASANPSPILGTAAFLFDNAGPGVGQLFWNDGNGGAIGIANITFVPGQSPLFFTAADFVLI